MKSFLRVDKEKVSSHLSLVHPHLIRNGADLTTGVPSPVAQVSPSALPEPSESTHLLVCLTPSEATGTRELGRTGLLASMEELAEAT